MKADYITVTPQSSSWRSRCNHSCLIVLKVRERENSEYKCLHSYSEKDAGRLMNGWGHIWPPGQKPMSHHWSFSVFNTMSHGHKYEDTRLPTNTEPAARTSIMKGVEVRTQRSSSPKWENHLFMELALFTGTLPGWNNETQRPHMIFHSGGSTGDPTDEP